MVVLKAVQLVLQFAVLTAVQKAVLKVLLVLQLAIHWEHSRSDQDRTRLVGCLGKMENMKVLDSLQLIMKQAMGYYKMLKGLIQ